MYRIHLLTHLGVINKLNMAPPIDVKSLTIFDTMDTN